ncbi:hypothetical protein SAMN04488241_1058 [Sphingomonas rubra]|uniref:Uncharacterized protein n=1 Tax=Sphingomonas rubra TaxID=634430 RepID=A0A1I5S6K4_9SPHN|nr:hypothetical protein SAMN04488241_1058 [Sphingomonas rubra]
MKAKNACDAIASAAISVSHGLALCAVAMNAIRPTIDQKRIATTIAAHSSHMPVKRDWMVMGCEGGVAMTASDHLEGALSRDAA